MLSTNPEPSIHSLQFSRDIDINAPIATAFDSVLVQLGPESATPEGPTPMVLEPWPGGRWYRDLGDNTGHLWGHVQVIRPPGLLEIIGPLFMSYAATSHVQYRLESNDDETTTLTLTHRAMGQIPKHHREGVAHGWADVLQRVQRHAQQHHPGA